VHGYGSDGNDLLGLAPPGRGCCRAEFLFAACAVPVRSGAVRPPVFGFEGRSEAMILAETPDRRRHPDAFIDADWRGAPPETPAARRLLQGTMMALHVAPRRSRAVAAWSAIPQAHRAAAIAAEVKSKPGDAARSCSADPSFPTPRCGCAAGLEAARHRRDDGDSAGPRPCHRRPGLTRAATHRRWIRAREGMTGM